MSAVADEALRSHLKDARLQQQILKIDKAPDREKVFDTFAALHDILQACDQNWGICV